MTVKSLYEVTRGILITFGTISAFFNGIFAFFPVFSYKPLFVGQSVCLTSPIWKGALAVLAGILILLADREQMWRCLVLLCCYSIWCHMQEFAVCCYSLAGITGTNHLGSPDPVQSEQYHLALQVLDTCSSLAIFCTASAVEIKLTMRLLQTLTPGPEDPTC
uniref:Transmembrane protein 212 n=1 Tax=Anas platyrhynchos platyrhynchos TaxID=8840 RepID=A0A493SUI7_ANAPP